jgi:hypothetical protein
VPILLAGMSPIALLHRVSHIVALKVMAAIHVQYPDSGIIRRIHVVHSHEAQLFFQQWPDALCVLRLYLGQVLTKVQGELLPRLKSGLPCGNDAQTPMML